LVEGQKYQTPSAESRPKPIEVLPKNVILPKKGVDFAPARTTSAGTVGWSRKCNCTGRGKDIAD